MYKSFSFAQVSIICLMFLLQIQGLKDPRGIAVDWITKVVYFVDSGDATISAVSVDGRQKVTVVGTGLDVPHDIVVDPLSGLVILSLIFVFKQKEII